MSLIPPLPDVIIKQIIWPMLMSQPSVQLLLLLRRVSRPWNQFVLTTLEWNSWTFIRLDALGYSRYAVVNRLIYCPFSQRFGFELAHYRSLVSENMEELASRLRYANFGRGTIPFYVSLEGCPPDLDLCREYYCL